MEDQMWNDQQVMLTVIWTVVATLAVTWLSGLIYSISFKKRNTSSNTRTADGIIPASIATASVQGQNYEVFLNFRGTDTRRTFTDHLYHRLVDVGVSVFRDNEGLHVGEEIHPYLLRAIQSSKISIPIISPDYASSKWCLHELVQIIKCRETSDQIVIPILYHVHPSDVRHQTGRFGKAFSILKKNNSDEDVQQWKRALKDVAALKVLELNDNVDGYEGELVKKVVEKVLTDLDKITMVVPEYLVGVKEQAGEIMEKLDLNSSNGVQLVLIHGMSGIGKTTLAKFLYNQLSNHFRFCSFPEITGEVSMLQVLKQLISNILKQERPRDIYRADEGIGIIKSRFQGIKILLVLDDFDHYLDDVNHVDQLHALIKGFDHFGPGSIVIITSKNTDVLNVRHVELVYELKKLNFDESLRLFCKHALQREDSHLGKFESVGKGIISTTEGLPLAIKVVGSALLGKGLDYWKERLKKLERMPHDKVHLKLKISYGALKEEEKKIFLDIALVFPSVGDFASFMHMWDGCGYYPRYGIEVLKSKSLIKIGSESSVTMHRQLRLLGREIIRQESLDLPGRCRILWDPEEACDVIERDQLDGTDQIEVLNLASDKRCEDNCFNSEQFERLRKLRFLQMKDANLVGNFKSCFLNLRWLRWFGCPSSFMATRFRPKNLVILDLSESNITEQWGGWNEMKCAEKLKVLRLSCCSQLKATPDFSTFRELEILDVSLCTRLKRIHPSIRSLAKTLKSLDLEGCGELGKLPIEMGMMEELRSLCLSRTSIREIPVVEGFMTKLEFLSARYCGKLAHLPDCIGSLTKLKDLALHGCGSFTIIPESIGKLKSLINLEFSYTNIKELPKSIGNLCNLRKLTINRTPIKRIPAAIGKLKVLRYFSARFSYGLTEVPIEIGELTILNSLFLEQSPISRLPILPHGLRSMSFSGRSMESLPNLSHSTNLDSLTLDNMDVIPELPSTLKKLTFYNCQALPPLLSFSSTKLLVDLISKKKDGDERMEICVQGLNHLQFVDCRKICKLSVEGYFLSHLIFSGCDGLKCLPDLSTFKYLELFHVFGCNSIVEVQGLDTVKGIRELKIYDCSSLERIGDFSHLTKLRELWFGNCPKLRQIDYPCLEKFTSLEWLSLYGGSAAAKLPDLPKFKKLQWLGVNNFDDLREIPKLQELNSLRKLSLGGCKSLENLPDFSEFTGLQYLNAQGCEKLTEIRGLENLGCFFELYIFGCRSLKQLPMLRKEKIFEQEMELWF